MSGNSRSSCLQTAPIVIAFARGRRRVGGGPARWGRPRSLTAQRQVGELVLADLQLVAVLEAVRLDPAAVHVGPVERAEVVDVEAVAAPHQQRVVARHGHVVEEDVGVGAPADRPALAREGERLADAPAARADDERGALVGHLVEVDRTELAGLVDLVGRGRARRPRLGLGPRNAPHFWQ